LFNELDNEFSFTLDVCAHEDNYKVDNYFSPEDDGLSQDWSENTCFCNPPYGRGVIDEWMAKCWKEAHNGTRIVCLIPGRIDTKWFHTYVYNQPNVQIRYVKGRLKYEIDGEPSKNAAAFPSLIVIYNGNGKSEAGSK
jgi:site-specific DNA-methyltransferase (adenine-specific)